ncbi:hypothetical protein B0H15DRAFT_821313 [Mycena belliarum]|uniref:Uncharacterized protein n=1 Tax=Mycena belliarum TaxID=1033014 RepID=A0AAD6XRR5_9AGAR|nr:hypothetical protein B0H15DRAFT_821313 [Mycena belliae]
MDLAQRRTPTPDSPLTNRDSLYDATTTIDDLTQALENVSRVPSPEPPSIFFCCCGRDDCENVQAWLAMKARLESRLTLSAEVGQALLQRHEAYVRRHQGQNNRSSRSELEDEESDDGTASAQDHLDELTKENKALEKRLTQALVNNEVTEVSNKTILQELAEAKTTISRLTTSHARSVGWDTRLSAAMKEKDDMQQERDAESQRARLAESRFAALKERTSKLQSDVRRLQNALEEQREHRLESSEALLVDARSRLEMLQRTVGAPLREQPELTGVLETLVDDNETLKRDNAELQTLLADAREDCRALHEEVEDTRVNPPPPRSGAGTPSHLRQHFYTGSVPSAMLSPSYSFRRSSSAERRSSRRYEPLTPETNRRPLSPTDSLTTSETKWTSFGQPQPRYPVSPSHASFEVEEQDADDASAFEKRIHKPLFLLARSRGVQTDPWPLTPPPVPTSYPPSHSPSSAASVYSDSLAPASNTGAGHPAPSISLSALVERTAALLQRMQTADALSLTNRLKRQQIRGADVGHLSRSTVAAILADVGRQLRAPGGPQEEEVRAGRRDVRALLSVLREMFGALGEIRVLLNEVVLDPASAGRVSEAAMDPAKAQAKARVVDAAGHGPSGAGWMAPLSKLFAGSPAPREAAERVATTSPLAAPRPMPGRFVPKLGPALAASATTVNVEFTGTGGGRASAMTSTFDAPPAPVPVGGGGAAPASGVMGIFAGAPRTRTPDPWVVIPNPKLPRRVPSLLRHGAPGRHHPNRMSRNVDAVLDGVGTPTRRRGDGEDGDEEPDYLGPLLERTLRRRGLSDSSIHSTFATQQAQDEAEETPRGGGGTGWHEGGSVLQALSRRVQSFRSGLSSGERERGADGASLSGSEAGSWLGTSPPTAAAPIAVGVSRRSSSHASRHDSPLKTSASVSAFGFLPTLASLVPSGDAAELARGLREQEGALSRTYRPPGHGHGLGGEREYM